MPGYAEAVQAFSQAVLQNEQELEHVQISRRPNKEHIWLQVSLQSSAWKAHRHCASALFCFVHLILFVDQDGTHAESCIKMLAHANNKPPRCCLVVCDQLKVLTACKESQAALTGIACHAPPRKSLL